MKRYNSAISLGLGLLFLVLHLVETATMTGGTGRFANASGGFTCERTFDMAARTTTGSFEGTLMK
jgi:hypothetical protein